MTRTLHLAIGDAALPMGTLRFDAQGAREHATFEYASAWLAADARFEIDRALPLLPGPHLHRRVSGGSVFPGAIADVEPDGWGRRVILRDHAKRRQQARRTGETTTSRPLNSLDFLLAVDDVSRVGALRLRDEHGVFQRAADDDRRTTPPLIELGLLLSASRAVETNSDTRDRALDILHRVEQAIGQWRRVGRTLGMTEQELDAFADAFEHEEQRAARMLTT